MTTAGSHYTVLARRFRPQAFDDVVGQEHVARALQNAIRAGRVAHAYMFTGARGVGKTSTARILAKALNCPNAVDGVPCNKCEICEKDEPELVKRRRTGAPAKTTKMALAPLKKLQVWRFSLYYFFVFGAFVALALWMPRYYVGAYGLYIKVAGMLAASFSIAASAFRAIGGWMSDKYGARKVMYWTFSVCIICCFMLSYPSTDDVIHGINGENIEFSTGLSVVPFTVIIFVLGLFMSFGKAAVYKHIPVYYPDNVGSA